MKPYDPGTPHPATHGLNHAAVAEFDMDNRQDFADADRGLIAQIPDGTVLKADGSVMFDLAAWAS